MDATEMKHIIQAQLAVDLNCTIDDLNGDVDQFVFTKAVENKGRRPFPRGEQHFEMLTLGRSIVVSTTDKLMSYVQSQLIGKTRDEAFEAHFVRGHSLFHIPDLQKIQALPELQGYKYELIQKDEIEKAYLVKGFHNAISYDLNHPRPDVLALLAKADDDVVGMAGASSDCERMWQIGVDVLPSYRKAGLASYLVNMVTFDVLRRGFVPYYGTSSTNVASQRVAYRAGYFPYWISSYRAIFEGIETQPTS